MYIKGLSERGRRWAVPVALVWGIAVPIIAAGAPAALPEAPGVSRDRCDFNAVLEKEHLDIVDTTNVNTVAGIFRSEIAYRDIAHLWWIDQFLTLFERTPVGQGVNRCILAARSVPNQGRLSEIETLADRVRELKTLYASERERTGDRLSQAANGRLEAFVTGLAQSLHTLGAIERALLLEAERASDPARVQEIEGLRNELAVHYKEPLVALGQRFADATDEATRQLARGRRAKLGGDFALGEGFLRQERMSIQTGYAAQLGRVAEYELGRHLMRLQAAK